MSRVCGLIGGPSSPHYRLPALDPSHPPFSLSPTSTSCASCCCPLLARLRKFFLGRSPLRACVRLESVCLSQPRPSDRIWRGLGAVRPLRNAPSTASSTLSQSLAHPRPSCSASVRYLSVVASIATSDLRSHICTLQPALRIRDTTHYLIRVVCADLAHIHLNGRHSRSCTQSTLQDEHLERSSGLRLADARDQWCNKTG